MNKPPQPNTFLTSEVCSDQNISFLMLSEVLRARSLEILDSLKEGQVDVTRVRHLALHMSLSAEDLIRSAGLLKPQQPARTQNPKIPEDSNQEPASLCSILDLCMIAAKSRLAELKLDLATISAPRDIFVGGNPWVIAYVLFLLLHRVALAEAQLSSDDLAINDRLLMRKLPIELEIAEGFADICIPSSIPINPHYVQSQLTTNDCQNLSQEEWFCFRRLLESNNALLHVQTTDNHLKNRFCIILRLPTFQPGHEEPIHFFTASEPPVPS